MPKLNEIGSRHQVVERTVVIAGPPTSWEQIADGDNRRWAIGFSDIVSGDTLISTQGDASINRGARIELRDVTWFTFDKHGAFVQVPWFAINIAMASVVTVWELIILD